MGPRLHLPLLALALSRSPRPAAALSATPNVLFIAVDDLRPEHGAFGGAALTPRVDAFAKTALTFTRNYVQVGVCSPSRTSLLTGRYPDTTHITDLWHYFRTFGGPNVTTLPEAFRLAGHATLGAGKIFHPGAASGAGLYPNCSGACGCACGGYNDPPSWDGYHIPPSMSRAPWNITYGSSWMALDENLYPDAEHPDGQTAAFISAQLAAAGERPFFLAPGFLKPHLPFIFPSRFLDLYANYDEIARDAAPPADGAMARDSWTAWSEFRAYADISALILADNLTGVIARPSNAMPRAKAVEVRRAYLAAVSYNDFVIGQVLDALTASGHDNDTTVVLWGDHGWQLGDHGDWAKHTNFESVVRAPLMIRSPLFAASSAGAQSRALTQHIDLYPTLLELAGLPPDTGLQGESLVPLLRDPELPALPGRGAFAYSQYPRNTTLCAPPEPDCGYAHAMGYRVRTPEYSYTEWVRFDNLTYTPNFADPNKQVELYNHTGDVGTDWEQFENANIAALPGNAALVQQLAAALHRGPNLLHPAQTSPGSNASNPFCSFKAAVSALSLTLECVNGVIDALPVALFGNQAGACPAWFAPAGACNDAGFAAFAAAACLGARSCTLSAGARPDPCPGAEKSIAAVAHCSLPPGGFSPDGPRPPPTLINHDLVLDREGGLLSWLQPQASAFSQFTQRSLVWFLNDRVPRDPQTGLPFYYVHGQYPKTDQETTPARQAAWGVEGAVAVFAFSGDRAALDEMAIPFSAYVASPNGTAPQPWAWAGAAFACANPEDLVFRGWTRSGLNGNGSGDGLLVLEPDKAAAAGLAYATLYQTTGEGSWLDAALAVADALVRNAVAAPDAAQSPWPFRVHAVTGAVLEYYCANVWPAVRLFDALAAVARVGGGALVPNRAAYAAARASALAWALEFPARSMLWQGQWEDMPVTTAVGANVNCFSATEAATYLLDLREAAATDWRNVTAALLDWLWRVFVVEYSSQDQPPLQFGAPVLAEQTFDRNKMGIHTAHWAVPAARFANETGNATLMRLVERALSWATYTLQVDNTSLVCPGDMNDWFACHAVMPAYFVGAMAAVPQWSAPGESHILRWTSPLREVNYSAAGVAYATYEPAATVWAALPSLPSAVSADGAPLPRVPAGGGGGAPAGWWSAVEVAGAWGSGSVFSTVVYAAGARQGVSIVL